MNNAEILCYIFVTALWNVEVIYATFCRGYVNNLIKFVRESVYGRFNMFYTIYLYRCCSINGKYCCSGYRWDETQNACVRKCYSYNTANIILNCKFKNS